ncbi:MAG TPA: SURF1 family protein [Terriglobia bacterium]|nr:SURF1 family protein [Terriglobia bacterium]
MSKRVFRPTLWPTLFTIPAVLVMIGLSIWQVQRLHWKEGLIADRQSRIAAAPIDLPPAGADLGEAEYRRVRLTGQFLHDHEMYLAARSMNGNVGYHIVTPMALGGGGTVLVDRGWVPETKKLPDSRPQGQLAGEVTMDGVVRLSQRQSFMQPDNEPDKNVWFYLDLPAMVAKAGLQARSDIYVEAAAGDIPGTYPLGGQTRINLPNDHLQYAITWALLAGALIVIYVIYHLRSPLEPGAQPTSVQPPSQER